MRQVVKVKTEIRADKRGRCLDSCAHLVCVCRNMDGRDACTLTGSYVRLEWDSHQFSQQSAACRVACGMEDV